MLAQSTRNELARRLVKRTYRRALRLNLMEVSETTPNRSAAFLAVPASPLVERKSRSMALEEPILGIHLVPRTRFIMKKRIYKTSIIHSILTPWHSLNTTSSSTKMI